jgi:hypothetical protein
MPYQLDNDIITSIRQHSGVSNAPIEAIELVWGEAEKAASERGTAIEFHAATLVSSLWARANMEHRLAGKAGQALDFQAYCRELLSKKDSLWKKLLGRKQSVAQAQADVAAYEVEINFARQSLAAAQQKVVELKQSLDRSESELEDNNDEAIEHSVFEAAKIWENRHKTAHYASVVEAAFSRVVEQEAVARILGKRLEWLRDALDKENQRVEEFKKALKELEK